MPLILVNFDEERAARTAEAFAELATTNQVLVFTCHASTVAIFREKVPGVRVVDMGDAPAAV